MVNVRTAYKVRAYPTAGQQQMLARTFGCIRVVWNKTLEERHRRYATESKPTSYKETDAALTGWKKTAEYEWLNEVSSVPLQQTLRHQHAAFSNFFAGRAKYPRRKNRNSRQSAHYTRSGFRIKAGALWLAKTSEPLAVVWSFDDVDLATLNPTMVIVSREPDGRYFVSFAVETDSDPQPLPSTGQAVGIDLGLKDFAVLSSGEKIAHPRDMERHERRLKRYQRRLSRCQKGSANRKKARVKVAKCHGKVADARRDFLNQASTRIVRESDAIAIENLNVSGMVKNRSLAKAISRTGWGEFRRQIEYKAERAGRRVVVVDRWYPSSKTCSHCGYLLDTLGLSTREWMCPDCGTRHDRDVNAAKNILAAAGLAASACGGDVRRQGTSLPLWPVKQENLSVRMGVPVL